MECREEKNAVSISLYSVPCKYCTVGFCDQRFRHQNKLLFLYSTFFFSGSHLLNKTLWIICMFVMNAIVLCFYITLKSEKGIIFYFELKNIYKIFSLIWLVCAKISYCPWGICASFRVYVLNRLLRQCRMGICCRISTNSLDDLNLHQFTQRLRYSRLLISIFIILFIITALINIEGKEDTSKKNMNYRKL